MESDDINEIKRVLLSPKQTSTAAGSITDRDAADIERAVQLLKKLDDEKKKRPALSRVGRYGVNFE